MVKVDCCRRISAAAQINRSQVAKCEIKVSTSDSLRKHRALRESYGPKSMADQKENKQKSQKPLLGSALVGSIEFAFDMESALTFEVCTNFTLRRQYDNGFPIYSGSIQ